MPNITDLVAIYGEDLDDDEYDTPNMANATERGRTLHAYIAHLFDGGAREDFEMPSDYAPYADAVDLFFAEHKPKPITYEHPMYSERNGTTYAGTPDCLAQSADGITTLYDWKFVATVCKPKVAAQLNGYRLMYEHWGVFPDDLAIIQFTGSGTYRKYPVTIRDTAFDLCIAVYEEKNHKQPRGAIN